MDNAPETRATNAGNQPRWPAILKLRESGIFISLVLIVLVILLSGEGPRESFLRQSNLQNLSRQIALLAIFAIGETFVVIAGGIDLSVGSLIAFSGVLAGLLMVNLHVPIVPAILIVLVASALVGLLHALLISKVGLQPFVATLGTMCMLRGVSLLLTDSLPIPIVDERFTWLGNGRPAGIPTPVIVLTVVAVLGALFLRGTIHGKYLYALGSNEEATRLSGINVSRVKIVAYSLCSLLTGLAGVVFAAYARQGNPSSGMAYELNAIAASVIGGCSLTGGEGSIIGTLLGATILSVILNGLNLIVSKNASLWEGVIVGTVVIAAVGLNSIRQRRGQS